MKSKGALRVEEILHLSARRKLEGSIGTVDLSLIAMSSAIDFSNGDNCGDSAEEVLQSKDITLSAWSMVLAQHVFPLLMKPTGDFEQVREFGMLFFIFPLGIDGLNISRG